MSPDPPSLALLIFFPCIHVPLQNLTLCPCVPRTKQCFDIPVMWRCGLVENYVPDHHAPLQIIWKVGFFTNDLPFSPLQLDLLPCSPHSMKPLEICDYFSLVSQVVQTLDSPIHRINHYQVGKPIVLSGGY